MREERRGSVGGDVEREALILGLVLEGELQCRVGWLHELFLLVVLGLVLVHQLKKYQISGNLKQ